MCLRISSIYLPEIRAAPGLDVNGRKFPIGEINVDVILARRCNVYPQY